MADRVKYFLLGVLFLVVAGVIAYDRWNSAGEPREVAKSPDSDSGSEFELSVDPPKVEPAKASPESKPQAEPEVVPTDDKRITTLPPLPQENPVQPVRPEAKPKAEPAPAPDKTHVIKKGETLEAIAIKYYGTRDGVRWIMDANKLGNANRIFANQKLVIPARKEIAKETKEGGSGGTTAAAAEKTSAKIPSRYRVKEGDGDLYAICRRLYGGEGQGARVHRVMEMNKLWSADVKPGTILILPPR